VSAQLQQLQHEQRQLAAAAAGQLHALSKELYTAQAEAAASVSALQDCVSEGAGDLRTSVAAAAEKLRQQAARLGELEAEREGLGQGGVAELQRAHEDAW
jgi:hypothetical protein